MSRKRVQVGVVGLSKNILSLCAENQDIAFIRTKGRSSNYEVSFVNEAWERLTGYSRRAIVGRKHGSSMLKGQETSSTSNDRVRRCIQTNMPFFGDVLNYKKDGTKFWNRLSIVPLRNGEYIGTCMDVTEHHPVLLPSVIRLSPILKNDTDRQCVKNHSQTDLPRRKRDRNAAFAGSSSLTVAKTLLSLCANNRDIPFIRTKDKSHNYEVTFVNEAWEKLTGYSSSAIIGRKYGSSMLKGRETCETVNDKIRRCVQAKEPFFGDVINYKKDGTKFVNRLSIIPLSNGEFIGTCMDATSAVHSIPTSNGVLPGIIDCINGNGRKRARGRPQSFRLEATAHQVRACGDTAAGDALRGESSSRMEEPSRTAEPLVPCQPRPILQPAQPRLELEQKRPQAPILDMISDGADGRYFVSTCGVHHVSSEGTASIIAGTRSFESGDIDGVGAGARFRTLCGITLSTDGKMLYVTDNGNHKIKQVCIDTGAVTSIAGIGEEGDKDGVGTAARLRLPHGIAASPDGSSLFFTDFNHKVKRLDLGTHNVTTVCGGVIGDCDGLGQQARFNMPFGIRVGKSSDCASSFEWRKQAGTQQDGSCRNVLFVADCGNNKVKQIDLETFDTVTLTGAHPMGKKSHMAAWYFLKGGFK